MLFAEILINSLYKELIMVDKKKKGGLAKRYQASYESKGSSGGKAGVMNWGKVNGDVQFFSPAEGRNRINIIPYTIKTKNHPLVKKGEFEVGDSDYVMDVSSLDRKSTRLNSS